MTDPHQPARKDIQLAEVLAALSDPQRLELLADIHARGRAACGTFLPGMPKSTRSHHLKVLREAGVTWTEMDGVERLVSLRYDCLNDRFPGLLDSILSATSPKKVRKK